MDKLPFLKTQRNQIFDAIQKVGIDPRDFRWEERKVSWEVNKLHPTIVHQPSGYFYLFHMNTSGKAYSYYSPGKESVTSFIELADINWSSRLASVATWLDYLKREIDAPDLWTAISLDSELVEAASETNGDDNPFSTSELRYISGAIKEIKEYIASTQNLSSDTLTFVYNRLDYLEAASKRQGRQSWMHTTIGVLFTIVVGAALAPDAARELFQFVARILNQVIHGPLLLP